MRRLAFGGALALGATALWCFLPLPAFFGSSEVLRRDPASLANVSPELGPSLSAGELNPVRAAPASALFEFSDPYRAGRSAWLARVLASDRATLLGPEKDLPETGAAEIEVEVHSDPFTEGDWLALLDETHAKERESAEEDAVEARVRFEVAGVRPERLIVFFAFSRFGTTLSEPGERTSTVFLRAPRDGEVEDGCVPDLAVPLGPGEFLTRDVWKGGGLAQPTDVWYRNRPLAGESALVLVHENVHDCGGPEHARVRFAAGQVAIRSSPAGSLVLVSTFFRGQGFPAIARGFVASKTRSYYERYVERVRELAPKWEPKPEHREWATGIGLELEP